MSGTSKPAEESATGTEETGKKAVQHHAKHHRAHRATASNDNVADQLNGCVARGVDPSACMGMTGSSNERMQEPAMPSNPSSQPQTWREPK